MKNKKGLMLKFILRYRNLPELWDTGDLSYSNRNKKKVAYEKLLEVYREYDSNATRETIVKKINSLRTNFRKEVRKIRDSKRSGSADVYVPQIWYFRELLFLTDHETPDSSRSTFTIKDAIASNNVYIDEESESSNQDEAVDTLEAAETNSNAAEKNNVSAVLPKRRRIAIKKETTAEGMCNMAVAELNREEDEYSIMAKAYAVKLKNMQRTQRLYADRLIHEILLEGQLNNLSRDTRIVSEISRPSSSSSGTSSNTAEQFTTVWV